MDDAVLKDTLGRRKRYTRQPKGKTLRLTDGDLQVLNALAIHGPLPSTYLLQFTRHKDPISFRKRLCDLYHETPYVDRPWRQCEVPFAHAQFMVYEITDHGFEALTDAGYRQPGEPHYRLSGNAREYAHRFMTACITASIALAVGQAGHRFIPVSEIWAASPTRDSPRPFTIPATVRFKERTHGRGIMPDALFGIEYGNGRRYFALEADRNNEAVFTTNIKNNTFYRKLLQYRDILQRRTFESHLGIPNCLILTVTTNHTHLDTMMGALRDLSTKPDGSYGSNPFLFKTLRAFSSYLQVPPLMTHLYTDPWQRVGRTPLSISTW